MCAGVLPRNHFICKHVKSGRSGSLIDGAKGALVKKVVWGRSERGTGPLARDLFLYM